MAKDSPFLATTETTSMEMAVLMIVKFKSDILALVALPTLETHAQRPSLKLSFSEALDSPIFTVKSSSMSTLTICLWLWFSQLLIASINATTS